MPKAITYEFEDINDILNMLEDSILTFRTIGNLLELALREGGGDLEGDSYGIARLMSGHADDLERIHTAAREEVLKLGLAGPNKRPAYSEGDAAFIARLAGVHIGATARVLFVLTGKDLAGDAYKREGDFGAYRLHRHLLERRIYDTLSNEVEWGRVIDETGLDFHKMQEVFHSMLKVSPQVAAEAKFGANLQKALLQRLGSDEIHRVAEKLGLDDDTVYNVAVNLAIPDEEAERHEEVPAVDKSKPTDPRKEIIADKLRESVDAGQIAQALNMKKATVERVIDQMMAEQPRPDPDRQAVNG